MSAPVALAQGMANPSQAVKDNMMRMQQNKLEKCYVDFDGQKSFARAFGARSQSTLIVFKDGAERGRSVGETNDGSIAVLLDRIL
jgi:hypothetical protein